MAVIEEPSLQSLLKHIPPAKLDSPCKDEHLCEVTLFITDWPSIAPYLKLTDVDQEEIQKGHGSVKSQKIAMLRKWKQKHGSDATYRELARTFWRLDRRDLVEELCKVIQNDSQHTSPSKSSHSPFKKLIPKLSKKSKSPKKDGDDVAKDPQLQPYVNHIRTVYQTENPSFIQQWPPLPSYKYISLAMKQPMTRQFGTDREHRTLLVHGKVGDVMGRRVGIEDILDLNHKHHRKVILIEGPPGAGKSVLAWTICQRWEAGELFNEYDIFLLVQLREPNVQMAQTLADIVPCRDKTMAHKIANRIEELSGKGTVFVLDGWDELPTDLQQTSFFRDLVEHPHKISLHESSVIITSRPISSNDHLHSLVSSRIEIVGFTPEKVEEFFKESLKEDPDPDALRKLKDQLKDSPAIESTCYLPLNAAIITYLFLALDHNLPPTLHELFQSVVEHSILRQFHRETCTKQPSSISLDHLPEKAHQSFKHLCALAHHGIMNDLIIFSEEMLRTLGIPVPLQHLGLMQAIRSLLQSGESFTYNFLHLSVQELLAAYHITQMPADNQVKTFKDLFNHPKFAPIFRFYAGFTKLQTEGIRNVISDIIQSEMEKSKSKSLLLSLLHCLYEAQDQEICWFVAKKVGELKFEQTRLVSADYLSLGHFLSCLYTDVSKDFQFPVCLSEQLKSETELRLLMKGLSTSHKLHCTPCGCVVLDLSKNNTIGSLCWINSLATNVSIVDLDLSSCSLQITNENRPPFISMLKENQVLKSLNLSNNPEFGELALQFVMEGVQCNTSLVDLDLSSCSLRTTDENGPTFINMLKENQILKSLNLSSNPELGELALLYIAKGLQHNSSLVQLNLSSCALTVTDRSEQALFNMLKKNTTVKGLNLSGNTSLGDTGIKCISEGISQSTTLILLNVRNCGITASGAKHLLQMLSQNQSLQSLNIGANHIGDQGISNIPGALKSNKTLRELLIPHCGITDEKPISEVLKTNRTLVKLDLSANFCITDTALISLGEGLRHNCGLEILKFSPQVTDNSLKRFILSLQNSHLTTISFWTWEQQELVKSTLEMVNHARKESGRPELKFVNK